MILINKSNKRLTEISQLALVFLGYPTFTCSKLTIGTLDEGMKYV